jgi:hypothetical protein
LRIKQLQRRREQIHRVMALVDRAKPDAPASK